MPDCLRLHCRLLCNGSLLLNRRLLCRCTLLGCRLCCCGFLLSYRLLGYCPLLRCCLCCHGSLRNSRLLRCYTLLGCCLRCNGFLRNTRLLYCYTLPGHCLCCCGFLLGYRRLRRCSLLGRRLNCNSSLRNSCLLYHLLLTCCLLSLLHNRLRNFGHLHICNSPRRLRCCIFRTSHRGRHELQAKAGIRQCLVHRPDLRTLDILIAAFLPGTCSGKAGYGIGICQLQVHLCLYDGKLFRDAQPVQADPSRPVRQTEPQLFIPEIKALFILLRPRYPFPAHQL